MACFAAAGSAVEAALAPAPADAAALADVFSKAAWTFRGIAALCALGGKVAFNAAAFDVWATGAEARGATAVGAAVNALLVRLGHALQTLGVLRVPAWAVAFSNDAVLQCLVLIVFLGLLCLSSTSRGRPSCAPPAAFPSIAADRLAAGGAPFPPGDGATAHRRRTRGTPRPAAPFIVSGDASDESAVTDDA
eukprot:TRINITY_DN1360_c0_g1_i2.p2 TRINITY_DN1360_c0_g1~~TRINITY_DN1360_c0_g1_i2.p2  ORF type:complete len:192 (-),score=50.54 TRINITY_DN1360_c0_g1_i2:500-1075(-)